MPIVSSDAIRAAFIDFWQQRGSHLAPSASLIPYNDPTVLFTIAGMQQFVPFFLGQQESPYPRYVSIQKCFRTNDIDEVGDPRHLTFFEMMGNFSIGDYFKGEVIPWAYEFATAQLGLETDRLWITVHTTDDEAAQVWASLGIPASRIVKLGDEDNWWGPPGKSGPCGPDSEMFYEQGPGHGCGWAGDPPDCECGRVEFWNLVFMQYFQDESGVRTPLPRKNVDTGIGLERTAALVQKCSSIYDTDLFRPVIEAAANMARTQYGASPEADYALRVLADHTRGMTFLVGDGVIPGAGGREYVLRRIIRRAVRYGRRLGLASPFLGTLAATVIERMKGAYPDLKREEARVLQVLTTEEEIFTRTLQTGEAQLGRLVREARRNQQRTVPGSLVFDLYQTFGFPAELTEEVLREEGLSFDQAEFDAALSEERTRAQARTAFKQARHEGVNECPEVDATEFLAWTDVRSEARVACLRAGRETHDFLPAGAAGSVIMEASAFYPEGGGQVGDTGLIRTREGEFLVEDTRFDAAGHIVHSGRVLQGVIRQGGLGIGLVDIDRRGRSMRHHTVTHLLHRALKDVLGDGTGQQGSLVTPDFARFDFNYARPLGREQLDEVSRILNERTMQDLPVYWDIMSLDQARQTGAEMMFEEKYGERVRVVSIGDYSRELCGGTHTHHSGELGLALIASESGIGSGKRRIVAYAGRAALEHQADRIRLLEGLSERLGAGSIEEAPQRLESVLEQLEQLRKELDLLRNRGAREEAARLAHAAREVRGARVVAARVDNVPPDDLKKWVDAIREELRSGVVVLGTVEKERPRLVVGITRDLAAGRLDAGRVLSAVARVAGGGGGGRPDFATGGGGDPALLSEALGQVYQIVERALGGDGQP